MILRLRVEHMKDASGEKKRVLFSTLTTEIKGMERIDAVAELDEHCILGREISQLIAEMLALKTKDLKVGRKAIIKSKKKK
jgi:hypothetical protein